MPTGKALLVLLIAGIVVAIVIALHHPAKKGPPLAKSCTAAGIALSTAEVGNGNNIDYSITGPATGTYVLGVDATAITVHGDGVTATPKAAFGAAIWRGLKGCTASGTLPTLPAGGHDVVLFRDGRAVAHARLAG